MRWISYMGVLDMFQKIDVNRSSPTHVIQGSGLQRQHLSKAKEKICKKPRCKWCAKAKITRHSFKSRDDKVISTQSGFCKG